MVPAWKSVRTPPRVAEVQLAPSAPLPDRREPLGLNLFDRPQSQHLKRSMIQFPAVVLAHAPISSDRCTGVDLLMVDCAHVDFGRTAWPVKGNFTSCEFLRCG